MDASRLGVVRWQLRLAWSLAELQLPQLTDEVCRWEPAPGAWTVREGADGRWRPDWAEPEPDPAPTTTVGWLAWHLIWWWTTLTSHATGGPVPARVDVHWPGTAAATVARLRELHDGWERVLDATDEAAADRPFRYPWAEPRPFVFAAAWANQELMKNVAEIGATVRLHAAVVGREVSSR
jgi:DinB superfamily